MLGSLFGDLTPRPLPGTPQPASGPGADPAGATTRTAATSLDVVVDDSPTETIRAHFAANRQDLQRASQMVTLLDPSRLWASQVLQALADASGQPVQRLNLRERTSLRTLAVIERTLVPRRAATPRRCGSTTPTSGAVPARPAWRRKKSPARWPKAASSPR